MLNALCVDIKRYLLTKSFMIFVLIAAVIQPLLTNITIWGFAKLFHESVTVEMNQLSSYSTAASIYLAAIVTFFLYAEAGEGIIRNKMISGKKRHHILLSYSIVNAALAVILQVCSVLVPALAGLLIGAEFHVQFAEIVRYTAIASLSGMAISVFYTVIYLSFCNNKMSVAVPGSIAIIMYILMVIITDALYTSSGIPKVSGTTLTIYQGIDRFTSFAHLSGQLRWDNASYIIGDVALIVISILAGSLIFAKKDMK